MSSYSRQPVGLSDAAKISELLVAVREKGDACERMIRQVIRLPLLSPFVPALRRTLQLSASLRLLQSSLTNPTGSLVVSLYSLLGTFRLVQGFLAPLVSPRTPVAVLQTYLRDGRALLARKVQSMLRLYALSVHELAIGVLEVQAALRQQLLHSEQSGGASAMDPSAPKQQILNTALSMPADERDYGSFGDGLIGVQGGFSSPLQLQDDYFGSDSTLSPYAIEKVAAARNAEAKELLHTYREFPMYVPLSAGASYGNHTLGMDANTRANVAPAAPPPFHHDLFPPTRSPLVLSRDYIPEVRAAEFAALQTAFHRLCIQYGSGSNVSSNPVGPRVIFLHGDAGLGGQEYAKYILHHLLLPPPVSAAAEQAARVANHSSPVAAPTHFPVVNTSAHLQAPGTSITSPPTFTHNYHPLAFSFARFGQAVFQRRREGLFDALQRKIKTASSTRSEKEAQRRMEEAGASGQSGLALSESAGGAAITTTPAQESQGHHTGPSTNSSANSSSSSSSTAAASGKGGSAGAAGRSAIPPLEKEKLASMHRLRIDGLTVAKSFLPPLAQCQALVGGAEVENGTYPSESATWNLYRKLVLDAPNIVLLSNVHLGDEAEISKLLFPPLHSSQANVLNLNRAIFIVQSRQPLKSLMQRCASHALSHQLCPMDEVQSMNAFIKISERRALLSRARGISSFNGAVEPSHALRFASIISGSIFVAQFLLRQIAYGLIPSSPSALGSATASTAPIQLVHRPPNEVSEWLCSTLESKPSAMVAFFVDNFFPSSQMGSVAPVVAVAFSLLSPGAQQLFVAIAYVCSGATMFSWKMIRAIMMHYTVPAETDDADSANKGGNKLFPTSLTPDMLELHMRELIGRGFITLVGEWEGGAANSFAMDDADDDSAAAAASLLPSSASSPPPHTFSSLHHARFSMHDILREFGLNLAHCGPVDPTAKKPRGSANKSGGQTGEINAREMTKYLGSGLYAQFCSLDTAPRFKRALQLHLVSFVSHQVASMDTLFSGLWTGRTAEGIIVSGAGAEDEEDDEEGEEDGDQPASAIPVSPRAASKSGAHRRATSAGATVPSSSPTAAERAEQLRQRAQLRQRLTVSLLEDEAKEISAQAEARRASRTYSFSRSATRGNTSRSGSVAASLGGASSRRSTLLIASRERNESSTLPAASFKSLPHAQPTELKTVAMSAHRLRALHEGDEAVDSAAHERKQMAAAQIDASTPPLRPSSPVSSNSPSPVNSGGEEESDSDEDVSFSVVPLAEEDDCDPEIALTLPAVPMLYLETSDSSGTSVNTAAPALKLPLPSHRRAPSSSSSSSLESTFAALARVQELEELEDESPSPAGASSALGSVAEEGHDGDEYDAGDFSDSSDEEYEEVSVAEAARRATLSRASVAARGPPLSAEAKLLAAMDEADAEAQRAIDEAYALAAEEEARLARELRELEEDHGEVVDHGRAAALAGSSSLRACDTLAQPVALPSAITATAGPMRLAQLATAVMHAVRPLRSRPRLTDAAAVAADAAAQAQATRSRGRSRASTTFAADATQTPSFIRQLQLAKIMYAFDVDLSTVLTALLYSYSCSKHNLHAVALFAPHTLYTLRLSNFLCKQTLFHHLEVVKPRYGRAWINGLWHLSEVYKSLGLLQKARDCLEEMRLIAVRQKEQGLGGLFASQVGVAAIHQSQLCPGRVAKFGNWIDSADPSSPNGRAPAATLFDPPETGVFSEGAGAGGTGAGRVSLSADSFGGAGGTSLAYPRSLALNEDSMGSSYSNSSGQSVLPAAVIANLASAGLMPQPIAKIKALPRLPAPASASQSHLHAVLDAILECYERALATLESSSLLLLSAAAEQAPRGGPAASPAAGDVSLGMHVFTRPLMFLLLRLGVFYTFKGAFQNALVALRRGVEAKASEVAFFKARRLRERNTAAAAGAQLPKSSAFIKSHSRLAPALGHASTPAPLGSLLPFALPSSTRLLQSLLFSLGLVYFRAGDLEEALTFFERARLIQARVVARRYRREKGEKGVETSWSNSSLAAARHSNAEDATAAAHAEADTADTAWTLSAPFLSSLATPAQAADIMAYVRTIYMLSLTHDRLAQQLQEQHDVAAVPAAGDSAPASSADLRTLASASALHAYRSLVHRTLVTSLWQRVTAGHKVVSMHDDMWRVVTGMSGLEMA